MRIETIGAVALLCAAAAPASVAAQDDPPAALAALVAEAEANNPEILAARRSAEAAAARVPQAGAPPDPTVGVGVMNLPAANPSLSADRMTMASVGLAATIPFPGKLGLREEIARLDAEAAEWEAERVRQRVVADVKAAYYELYFLDRALGVTERNEALLADLAKLTSARYGVGQGAQPDILKAQVERTGLEDRLVELRERRASAVARLNALLGRSSGAPVPETHLPEEVRTAAAAQPASSAPTFAYMAPETNAPTTVIGRSVGELQRLALEHNPMIQAHVRRVRAQTHAVALAGKAKLPDLQLSAGYGFRADAGDFVNLMVSVPVPIFAGRKQDRQVDEAAATLAEHEARHHAMVNELNAEITRLAAEIERARGQIVLLRDGILPQARASLASATSAYRVGSVDFLTLLDAQVKLYRHELDHHRLLADFATNVAALERAVGTEVLR
jgi:outer membrane protein TolC